MASVMNCFKTTGKTTVVLTHKSLNVIESKTSWRNFITYVNPAATILPYQQITSIFDDVKNRRSFHTSSILDSRIKFRYTHKPFFHTKKTAKVDQSPLTPANRAFLEKVLNDTYNEESLGEKYAYVAPPKNIDNTDKTESSPLKTDLTPWPRGSWDECGTATTRIGLIGRKIGVVPMWLKNGKQVSSTMLHIDDNHVIRYISAEDFSKTVVAQRRIRPYIMKPTASIERGSIVVGALSADPSKFTKDYCGLFTESGIMPKKKLIRCPVSSNALIQPGTPLYASHFQVGQHVDVISRSSRRGFHGGMKRWGFKGMPLDNRGVTKSHRRIGCIGSGRDKGRVWPGQKMPGHKGGDMLRVLGLKILRINHKHNVIYVHGQGIPGEPGEFVKIFDCKMKAKRFEESPRYFPTCYPEQHDELLKDIEEEYDVKMHKYTDPTISYT